MANPRTVARLEARIKERVAHCVEFELADPRSTFITITRVELTNDISQAKVYYSVLGDEADRNKTKRMLESAGGFIQRQVARILATRRTPKLEWRYDDTIEQMIHMDEAVAMALERDREINPKAHRDSGKSESDSGQTRGESGEQVDADDPPNSEPQSPEH